jgi:transposase
MINVIIMANKPISMNKIRQILRLHSQGVGKLTISYKTGSSRNTIRRYITEFDNSGLTYREISVLTDKDLEDLFVKPDVPVKNTKLEYLFSLFPALDKEMKKKGVTRQILWAEYKKNNPNGVGRSQFNFYFTQWKAQVSPTMRMEHKAGDKLYVDFAGDKLNIIDKTTGEITPVEVFVSILGASQLTYVEAVRSQQKEDFIEACENALHYYGGVPQAIVPDNLKSAVKKSSKYEPVLNETFADFAEHYGTTILPARAYRPRDKALVEGAVKIIYTRIYAKIMKENYFSLEELNAAIIVELENHNNMLLSGRNYSRRQQFEEVERATLSPLPLLKYELKKELYVTVMKNGHVSFSIDKHYYSVPYKFIGRKVKLRYSSSVVEIFYNYERIAFHNRMRSPHNYTTDKEHMASTHRFVSEWTAERFLKWAQDIHEDVYLYILKVLDRKQHPEQAYKSCVGILSFSKKAGNERLIKACQRANGYGLYNYKTIQNILERGLDAVNQEEDVDILQMPYHDNIRGEDYYK